ncbi:MAG: sensor histidine kinase [Clostridiales bacterium]|jgi:two-component system sensor histidine kinase YesM|nr:sensor histidine kinase [Clostridiales bacterium]
MVKIKRKSGFLNFRFQNHSFQFMLSLSFTVVAVVGMIFVSAALYLAFFNSTLATLAADHQLILEQVNLNLDGYLRNMMRISDSMYFRVLKNVNLSRDNVSKEMALLYDVNRDRLVTLSLFSDEGSVIASTPLSALKPSVDVTRQRWFASAWESIENLHFSTPHVQNLFENSENKYNWVVSLSRSVNLTYNGEIRYGVLLVDMNFSAIEQICRRVSLGDTSYIYIINGDGELIYHPKQQLIYGNLLEENTLAVLGYEDGNHLDASGEHQKLVTIKTVGYTGWKIISVSYLTEVMPGTQLMLFAILILLFGIALMVFVNYLVSANIANPIQTLEKAVRDIEKGGINAPIPEGGSAEVRTLGLAINNMLARNRKLMDEIVWEQEQKRKSEFDALQAQITPHFLYNALDCILWSIKDGEYETAMTLISVLSKMFRISISKGRSIISVKDEIEHAQHYLTIQNTRFKNRFNFTFNVQPEVYPLATIKLIIQPIIENAIYHGMEYMDGDGLIVIDSYLENGDLYFKITDNGMGMTEEVVAGLLTGPAARAGVGGGSGIGLYNVQERIHIYFGREYGLTIESEPDEGTRVLIRLPARVYDPDKMEAAPS